MNTHRDGPLVIELVLYHPDAQEQLRYVLSAPDDLEAFEALARMLRQLRDRRQVQQLQAA